MPLAAMGLTAVGIAYGITYSVTRVQVKRDGRTLSIYRSLGMTAARLRLAILSGTAIPTLAGALLGAVIGMLFMPPLLEGLLHGYGIVEFPAIRDAGSLSLPQRRGGRRFSTAAGWLRPSSAGNRCGRWRKNHDGNPLRHEAGNHS